MPGPGSCYGKLFEGIDENGSDDNDDGDSDDDDDDDDVDGIAQGVDDILGFEYHWGLQNMNWDG